MRTHFRPSSLIAAAALAAACTAPGGDSGSYQAPTAEEIASAESTIVGESMREVIATLADDEMEGRLPGTAGDAESRAYIESRLERVGFAPGGVDGSYLQPFTLVGVNSEMPASWSFSRGNDTLELGWWDDYIAAAGVQEPSVSIEDAELVFVGYGIEAPEEDWDDFKGVDVSGKMLLMLNNDPEWDPELFEGERRLYYGRWTYKYESAALRGAAGAIIIHTTESAGYPWQVVQTSWSGTQFELPAGDEARVDLAGWVTDGAAAALVAMAGHELSDLVASARSRDFEPVPLGISTSIDFRVALEETETANVLGMLEGSDPALRDEVIVYSAHHDHLGVGEPDANGDTIYNGALDNATGVAQLLSIAEAFSSLAEPPRRSILMAFVGAEEQGLLGSKYYATHPTVSPGKLAANLNFDGGNIWGATHDVTVIGQGKSTLEELLVEAARGQDRVVVGDTSPDKGYYYRSDQFNFAKIGVPAIYFESGKDYVGREPGWGESTADAWLSEKYHQPGDELEDDWSFDGLVLDAKLGFRVGLEAADADAMPTWYPGDEFEAVRKEALAAESGE